MVSRNDLNSSAPIAPLSSQDSSSPSHPSLARLHQFIASLSDVLVEMTALEVSTMVVEQITGEKFSAWESYREIYAIAEELESFHESLRDRYLQLRKKLELEYLQSLSSPNSSLYNPDYLETARTQSSLIKNSTIPWQTISTSLPNPFQAESIPQVQLLLRDSHFLCSLRKMAEVKMTLDARNQALLKLTQAHPHADITQNVKTDQIYAQTVIQMDGDIIHRYSQDLFEHPHQDLILQIHREGVQGGERQWRGLLGFVMDMVQKNFLPSR